MSWDRPRRVNPRRHARMVGMNAADAAEAVRLRDGTELFLRPIRPDDAPRLRALHSRLSPESIYLRFLGPHPVLTEEDAGRLATVDYRHTMAIVAVRKNGEDEAILGVARYAAVDPKSLDEAEVAIVVEDAYQGRGLGTLLMRRLIDYARRQGVAAFSAEITAGNERVMRFIRRSGLTTERSLDGGVWHIRVNVGERGP